MADVANIFANLVNGTNAAKGKKVTIGAATAGAPPSMEVDDKISEEGGSNGRCSKTHWNTSPREEEMGDLRVFPPSSEAVG